MGLSNFTGHDDDDSNPPGNGPSGLASMLGGAPPQRQQQSGADPTDMLVDYNARFATAEPTLFRDALVEQMVSVLISKNKPNVLLKGAAGVGKTRVVEDLARRIAVQDPLIPSQLAGSTIWELPVTNIVAGSGIVGEIEEKVKEVVDFASDPKNDVILFIDEIHQITGGSSSHGDHSLRKISQILKPALARGDMRVIGATTSNESNAFDEDPAFARRFTPLVVDELTVGQTREVLAMVRPGLVAHYRNQITVSDDVLSDVVRISEDHARANQHRPDSAITLLDRSMAGRVLEQRKLIAQAEADGDQTLVQILRSTPNVPLTRARVLDVATRLMTGNASRPDSDVVALRADLHSRLRGQDEVLDRLCDRLERQRLGLFPQKLPTTWLLAGASGVGKTETAKIISRAMTGADPIILNMTEFHTPSDTAKIVGAPPGYIGSDSNQELPFDTLESNPHRVILLDEFEKADKAVQRLFLSAFDEGFIRNSHGKLLDFSKAVVIATTNAAREALSGRRIGFGDAPKTSNASLSKILTEFFDAELLGRFSLIVGYQPIGEDVYRDILVTDYAAELARIGESNPRAAAALPDEMPDADLDALVRGTYVASQGARPAARAVRSWIEDALLAPAAPSPDPVAVPGDGASEA